jgi:hypothetical protein
LVSNKREKTKQIRAIIPNKKYLIFHFVFDIPERDFKPHLWSMDGHSGVPSNEVFLTMIIPLTFGLKKEPVPGLTTHPVSVRCLHRRLQNWSSSSYSRHLEREIKSIVPLRKKKKKMLR